MTKPILPGATLGVLGSGQLGRMFALAARRMGFRVATFSPATDTPTGQVADIEAVGAYEDLDAVATFAKRVDAVTFEFENVPIEAAEEAAKHVPVRPRGEVLRVAQNRLVEKTFLADNGFRTAAFERIDRVADLPGAIERIGVPAVLKTAGFGYDGKGQAVIRDAAEAEAAWERIGGSAAILEGFIDFACEVSVVGARGVDGAFADFGLTENRHANHILDLSLPDADRGDAVRDEAVQVTRAIMERLDAVGVLCVEFFLTRDGDLLVNEMAPRPHNSGHFTFDACLTSQFEQQVRTTCALPLGATDRLRPSAMVNLLGDLWTDREPRWAAALADPMVKLHLYGKADARAGRKMGHIVAFGTDSSDAARRALAAREALTSKE